MDVRFQKTAGRNNLLPPKPYRPPLVGCDLGDEFPRALPWAKKSQTFGPGSG